MKKHSRSKNKSKNTPIDYTAITQLDLSFKQLTELPDLSKYINLTKLNCQYNKLTNFTNLPSGLKVLECSHNSISNFDDLASICVNLEELACAANVDLITLNCLPVTLKKLDCSSTLISNLDNLPPNLEKLNCMSTDVTRLDSVHHKPLTRLAFFVGKSTLSLCFGPPARSSSLLQFPLV
jgi:Leucine-rich repeat (LRR) protein